MRPSNHNHNDQFNFKIVEIPSPYGKAIRCAKRDLAVVAIEWDYLTLMDDEEVDYATLPEEVLTELALGGELYMATSAVTELSIRQSEAIIRITWQILSNSAGDQYLQAAALEALFEAQREDALAYMLNHAATCEPYLLDTMNALISWHHLESRFEHMISKIKNLINERLQKQNGHYSSPLQARLMPYLGTQNGTANGKSAQELDWLRVGEPVGLSVSE